jgi:hypothetical protein
MTVCLFSYLTGSRISRQHLLDPALVERVALTNKCIPEAEAADASDDVDSAEHSHTVCVRMEVS